MKDNPTRKELTLEEQLKSKREEEKTAFIEGLKELQEKYGYALEPVRTETPHKVEWGLNVVPTR